MSHGRPERLTPRYRVCFECSHVYRTRAHLVAANARAGLSCWWGELHVASMAGRFSCRPRLLGRPKAIGACAHCGHDF
ncbi:MAG TPA: hypothetical protein VND92_08535 [Vicinamibacterales bacterium]|nr:hypothetical protein [Vicinamibacterales bacterium]